MNKFTQFAKIFLGRILWLHAITSLLEITDLYILNCLAIVKLVLVGKYKPFEFKIFNSLALSWQYFATSKFNFNDVIVNFVKYYDIIR